MIYPYFIPITTIKSRFLVAFIFQIFLFRLLMYVFFRPDCIFVRLAVSEVNSMKKFV